MEQFLYAISSHLQNKMYRLVNDYCRQNPSAELEEIVDHVYTICRPLSTCSELQLRRCISQKAAWSLENEKRLNILRQACTLEEPQPQSSTTTDVDEAEYQLDPQPSPSLQLAISQSVGDHFKEKGSADEEAMLSHVCMQYRHRVNGSELQLRQCVFDLFTKYYDLCDRLGSPITVYDRLRMLNMARCPADAIMLNIRMAFELREALRNRPRAPSTQPTASLHGQPHPHWVCRAILIQPDSAKQRALRRVLTKL